MLMLVKYGYHIQGFIQNFSLRGAHIMCIKNYDVYLASERDTYRGNTIENRGCQFIYLFICIYVWTYVRHFCTLTLAFLC